MSGQSMAWNWVGMPLDCPADPSVESRLPVGPLGPTGLGHPGLTVDATRHFKERNQRCDARSSTSSPAPEAWLSLIHISEPTRLGMISYAVFCLKKKKK